MKCVRLFLALDLAVKEFVLYGKICLIAQEASLVNLIIELKIVKLIGLGNGMTMKSRLVVNEIKKERKNITKNLKNNLFYRSLIRKIFQLY